MTEDSKAKKSEDKSETIRVHVDILDNLMNQVGELVLVRNQFLQTNIQEISQNDFMNGAQRLNIITSEIQNEIMRTRMQPIGKILTKFNRVVRDIANSIGKKIELSLEGTETELDKSLVEAIKDPLTHIVRNSCDHGIEVPEERKKQGKNEQGLIHIKSYHEGGQVIVEIRDDGRGLNPQKLIQKAIDKNLISADTAQSLNETQVYQLIFHPGFSTAEKVSNLSGRGVGMDVVKSNIEQIGGTVELSSKLGEGTSIIIKIPLTLAILPALIISSCEQRFAVPQVKLIELLRLAKAEPGKDGVETLQNHLVYRLRGKILPLVDLQSILTEQKLDLADFEGTLNVAVLKSDHQEFGLIIDQISDSADIVVKPLARFLEQCQIYSGATVMGDGSIALVLDINALSDKAFISEEIKADSFNQLQTSISHHQKDIAEYLIIDINQPNKMAIQLELVNRLEEFPIKNIEYTEGKKVVQYRETILPILSIEQDLHLNAHDGIEPPSTIAVVVIQHQDQLYGLEVNTIIEVIASNSEIDTLIRDRPGILGNLEHEEDTYIVVDAIDLIERSPIYIYPSQKSA